MFCSGGTLLTITGENLIIDDSSTKAFCKVPVAPKGLQQTLETRRQRRATACVGCQEVEIVVKLDGVERNFTLKYFHDPSLSKFNNGMKLFNVDQQFLTVEVRLGKNKSKQNYESNFGCKQPLLIDRMFIEYNDSTCQICFQTTHKFTNPC
ncbi:hypothetical protein DPMN_172911 [Dreissena polymorpha]|uniref:Uncharacterized protein n=1 Tax=Dreissena polymorpha TaxID=45954 RepID=A0A9D4E1Q5_DREPO|nr:hypothetical protein DPMN_172911 [Dreissena polymorpha]